MPVMRIYTAQGQPEPVTAAYEKNIASPEDFHMHLNSMCEIYVFAAGGADYVVEDRCYPLAPYDVLLLNPYEPHRVLLHEKGMYERYYFLFPLDCFLFMPEDPLTRLIREMPKRSNLISLSPEKKSELTGALAVFRQKDPLDTAAGKTLAYAALLRLLGLLTEHVCAITETSAPSPAPAASVPPILTDVMRYIDGNLNRPLTVEEIAAETHFSAPYLSRLFSAKIGVGMKRYILIRRVGLAKRMLDEGSSVTDACFACGWSDMSYFIRVFKAYTGITPHQYGKGK